MNRSERNWNNLFGEYTTEETAWHGCWTTYSPKQEVRSSKKAIRSFQSNADNTVITHINRYVDAEEKIWHIDREICNQPDGVIHPAIPFMRALSFGAGASAWVSPRFIPGKPFGVEFFFRDGDWRTSVALVYREDGLLNRIVQIQEHLDHFCDDSFSIVPLESSGNWSGNKLSMSADLSISSEEETQISFSSHEMISLPIGMIVILPEQVSVNQSIEITAAQQTASNQLKYFKAHYDVNSVFTSLVSASLQRG